MDRNLLKLSLISIAIVLAYAFFIAPLSSFTKARLLSLDLLNKCVYKLSKPPQEVEDITVVSIDRDSLRNLERSWPWPRSLFAEFILKLNEYKPRIVYLDFSFIGESQDEEEDNLLAQALDKSGNALIPFYFDENAIPLFPLQKFMEASSGFGAANKLNDIDFTVRDMPLIYFSPKGRIIDYSIELITICKYLGVSLDNISFDRNMLRVKIEEEKKEIPITKDGILHINYLTTLNDINTIPFWKVLKEELQPEIFKDKIVIVGITDKAFIDTYKTPLGITSGVEIVVNTILTILSGNFIIYALKDINLPLIMFMMLLITITVYKLSPLKALSVAILELLGYLAASIILFWIGWHNEIFSVFFLGIIIYMVTKICKFIYILEDQNINLQKALADLKEAEAELIESEKLSAIGRLSAQISHEINNPLCTIQNNVEIIENIVDKYRDTEKIKEITKRISGELDRLSQLSRDILLFARPLEEEIKPININTLISDTISFWRTQLEKIGIEVSLYLDDTLPPTTVPVNRFKQVLSNLILNAQQAMNAGGKLIISTKLTDDGFIQISLVDTGSGIPSHILDKIFEPFFSTKKEGKGTGLGLYTVRSIIKRLGGKINVSTTVGKGTVFDIILPVKY